MFVKLATALLLMCASSAAVAGCKWINATVIVNGQAHSNWIWQCDSPDPPGDGEPGGGGDGGGSGGPDPAVACTYLAQARPPSCPTAIKMPSGAEFGAGSYAGGSGLAKLIYLKNSGLLRDFAAPASKTRC